MDLKVNYGFFLLTERKISRANSSSQAVAGQSFACFLSVFDGKFILNGGLLAGVQRIDIRAPNVNSNARF